MATSRDGEKGTVDDMEKQEESGAAEVTGRGGAAETLRAALIPRSDLDERTKVT